MRFLKMFPAGTTSLPTVMLVFVLGGCGGLDIPFLSEKLPPELAYVSAHEQTFTTARAAEGVSDVIPGTVVDDLSGLSGCWGVHFPPGADPDVPLSLSFVWMFDTTTGTVTYWSGTDYYNLAAFVVRAEGTFTVDGDNRVTGSTVETYVTGGLPFDEMPVTPFDWAVTIVEDRLIIGDYDSPDREPPSEENPPFVRFECLSTDVE